MARVRPEDLPDAVTRPYAMAADVRRLSPSWGTSLRVAMCRELHAAVAMARAELDRLLDEFPIDDASAPPPRATLASDPATSVPVSASDSTRAIVRAIVARHPGLRAAEVLDEVRKVRPTPNAETVFSALAKLSRSDGPLIKEGRMGDYRYRPRKETEV